MPGKRITFCKWAEVYSSVFAGFLSSAAGVEPQTGVNKTLTPSVEERQTLDAGRVERQTTRLGQDMASARVLA
jgi:hypothetical protein